MIPPKGMTLEEMNIMLFRLEGTFYSNGNNSIDYFRFYVDKTVLHVVVGKPVFPLDIVLKWFNKENENVAKGEYEITRSPWMNLANAWLILPGEKPNINSKISFSIIDPSQRIERKYSGEIISKNEIKLGQKTYVRLALSDE